MKKYLLLTKVGFQTVLEYRFNFFWKVFSRLVISLVLIIFWYLILEYNTSFEKVTPEYMIRYYILMGFIFSLNIFDIFEFSATIREGDIVNIIAKPLNHLMYWFFKTLPSKMIVTAIYILVFISAHYSLDINILPRNLTIIPFFISLSLGITGSFLLNYCIGLLTIWLQKVYGIYDLVRTIDGVLGGTYIPILILPAILKNLSKVLPLRYFSYLPVDISQQSIENKEILIGIVNRGNFDFILTKPYSSLIYSTLRIFSFEHLIGLVFPLGIIAFVLVSKYFFISFLSILLATISILISIILVHLINVLTIIPTFRMLNNQLHTLYPQCSEISQYPLEILDSDFKRFIFLFLIPLGVLVNIPFRILIKKLNIEFLFLQIIICIIFITVTRFFWKLGIKSYSSASS